ncbi:unnamed protein product [Prorocentrum cordatum]|uniref:Uncharacterized protein n=1 Tax=Prorocentrum cordatum TaxID=2364126 RepID=A0ABN9W3Y7_9DINO|nr:unnamed protein product [Polarella glacialis]
MLSFSSEEQEPPPEARKGFGNWYNYDRRPLAWDCRCTPLSSGCDDVPEAEAGQEQLNASASSGTAQGGTAIF